MQRYLELDALRGLMLIWITLTHLPTGLSRYANQPLGYLSATEGFICLSALFTGMIYVRLAERSSYRAVFQKIWERSRRLYYYQLLLLTFAFALMGQLAAHSNRPAIHNLLDYYFSAGPVRAGAQALLLLYRPPLLDILPMYIVLLALTPVLLLAASRVGWKAMVGGSTLLWLLAQLGLREAVYHLSVLLLGLRIPLPQMGAFDLWAWQLWWVIGLWLGARWARGEGLPFSRWMRGLTPVALAIALCLLVLRYVEVFGAWDFGRLAFLADKWHLGALRMANFAAVATLAIRFHTFLRGFAIRPLVMLGQSSLQVFCVHLVAVFVALAAMGTAPVMSGWRVPAFIAASLLAQWFTAVLAGRKRIRKSSTESSAATPEQRIATREEWRRLRPATTQKAA